MCYVVKVYLINSHPASFQYCTAHCMAGDWSIMRSLQVWSRKCNPTTNCESGTNTVPYPSNTATHFWRRLNITLFQVWGWKYWTCMIKAAAVDHSMPKSQAEGMIWAEAAMIWIAEVVSSHQFWSGTHQFCLACALGTPHHPSFLAHMFAIICFVQVLASNDVKMPKLHLKTVMATNDGSKLWGRYNLMQDIPTLKPLDNWISELECIWMFWIKSLYSTVDYDVCDVYSQWQWLAILDTPCTKSFPKSQIRCLQPKDLEYEHWCCELAFLQLDLQYVQIIVQWDTSLLGAAAALVSLRLGLARAGSLLTGTPAHAF